MAHQEGRRLTSSGLPTGPSGQRSAWSEVAPFLLESRPRSVRRVQALDISLTARPHYQTAVALNYQTAVALRSRADAPTGVIYRASPAPIEVVPARALEAPGTRDYLSTTDYLADPLPAPAAYRLRPGGGKASKETRSPDSPPVIFLPLRRVR
jgi:hypothetical protein